MNYIKKKVFALATLLCAVTSVEAYAKHESVSQYFVDAVEEKIGSSIWKHFDFSRKRIYLRLDGGWRKYSSRITGFTKRPKSSEVFGYGIGYRFTDYPMRVELSVQRNNFKSEEGTTLLKSRTQNFSVNLYRDFNLPDSVVNSVPIVGRLMPYITAGVGGVIHSKVQYSYTREGRFGLPPIHETYQLQNNWNTSWNVGIGTKLVLAKQLSADFAFRHVDLGNITIAAGSNNIKARIRGYQSVLSLIVNM